MSTNIEWSKNILQNIPEIKETDKDDQLNLSVFCYTVCNLETNNDIIKECRGNVFHEDKMIVKTLGFTPEFTHLDVDQINEYLGEDLKNSLIFSAEEGAILRLFHHSDRWFLSTHKKLDAFKSKWGTASSFGELFLETLLQHNISDEKFRSRIDSTLHDSSEAVYSKFLETLDKTKVYLFLIKNNMENRIVCTNQKSEILHIGCVSRDDFNTNFEENINIPYPRKYTFETIEDMCQAVGEMDPFQTQGLFVYVNENKHFKILNERYAYYQSLRGNDPSISRRYLFIRNTDNLKAYCELYPEYDSKFKRIEITLDKIASYIYNAYIRRFIRKEYAEVPPQEYQVIRACHSYFLDNKSKGVQTQMTLEKVKEKLELTPPFYLWQMVERHTNGYGI
jgi:hypothetical protein